MNMKIKAFPLMAVAAFCMAASAATMNIPDNWTILDSKRGEVPLDISALPEKSLVRQKYVKCFDCIPKPIRNWQDKKYRDRRRYLDSEAWAKAKTAFAAKLATMSRKLAHYPAVTDKEVMTLAEELVVYGRGLAHGSFPVQPSFAELAKAYGFTEAEKFLKKSIDVDRYRHTGMERQYPEDKDEFKDFDKLAQSLFPDEWKELRTRWKSLNELYVANQKAQAAKAANKKAK